MLPSCSLTLQRILAIILGGQHGMRSIRKNRRWPFMRHIFASEILGPGVAAATYGGAIFLYPPRPIPDIWTDEALQFCETLEETIGCGCMSACPSAASGSSELAASWHGLATACKTLWQDAHSCSIEPL